VWLLDVVICGCEAPLVLDAPQVDAPGPRLPITPYPETFERRYSAALRPLVDDLRKATGALIEALGSAALRAKVADLEAAVLARWTERKIIRAIPLADMPAGVDALHEHATAEQLTRAIELSPLDVPEDAVALIKAADGRFSEAKAERWVKANVKLIKSIGEEHFDRVADLTADAVAHGRRAAVLAGQLREATGVSSRKAKLIARDQIASLQGQVVQARQTRLGIERYKWRTVGDARVRTEHRLREGQIFRWDRPPPDGHPGQPINCRCYAEPVIDDVLKAAAGG
jgi:SPP1 gp7 family putative phage head morphogenesis protein